MDEFVYRTKTASNKNKLSILDKSKSVGKTSQVVYRFKCSFTVANVISVSFFFLSLNFCVFVWWSQALHSHMCSLLIHTSRMWSVQQWKFDRAALGLINFAVFIWFLFFFSFIFFVVVCEILFEEPRINTFLRRGETLMWHWHW